MDLSRIKVTEHDCRLLELMALKKRQQCLQEIKAERQHAEWVAERKEREQNRVMLSREWQRNLEAKRKQETEDNQRRLRNARTGFINSQELLRKLLKEKDERKKVLLENMNKKRVETMKEQREVEEARSQAVVNAVKELLARDTQYRKALQADLERRQETAEKRRKQKEEEERERLLSMNRSEAKEHKERLKKIDAMYSQHIQRINRKMIQEKRKKTEKILHNRERAVQRARKMAFKTAELRDVIRNQTCPENLDLKTELSVKGTSLQKNSTEENNSSHLLV